MSQYQYIQELILITDKYCTRVKQKQLVSYIILCRTRNLYTDNAESKEQIKNTY